MNELAHHGTNDQFGRFARISQPLSEAFAPVRFVQRSHRGHVQGFSDKGVTDLGHPGFAFDAGARLVLPGIEPHKSHCLACIVKLLR